jgi:Flp pilus assembly protein TadD
MALTELSSELLYGQAFALLQNGQGEKAESLFRILTRDKPDERPFWMGLGMACQKNRAYSDALEAFREAAEIDQQEPHVHIAAAECFFALEKKEQALLALKWAEKLQLEPALKERVALYRRAWK